MQHPHLVYFADPMCSWCWGFSPVIEAVRERYGERLPVRLVMGGLRPGTKEPMSEAAKREVRSHWEHVREASGQPFDFRLFERENFVYDTEPAAMAVVAVRSVAPDLAFGYLRRAHAAFYAESRDVTSQNVLADLAAELGFERDGFLEILSSEDLKRSTWQDFALSQSAGVTGFPTLIASTEKTRHYAVVTRGFQPVDAILPVLDQWLAEMQQEARVLS